MSILNPSLVKHTSEALGYEALAPDVVSALTTEVDYRLREIVQEAKKFMRHARRSYLTTHDVSLALRIKNVEPLYGFLAPRPVKWRSANENVYYIEDDELDLDRILAQPLPKLPLDVALSAHWLSIDGVQPSIPQNPSHIHDKRATSSTDATATGNATAAAMVKDVLSREFQLYFEKVTESLLGPSDDVRAAALSSIRTDPGLQSLLPYFVQFAADQVTKSIRSLGTMAILVAFLDALLHNNDLFLEPYLHQITPILITVIATKQLGSHDPTCDHWTLRDNAATLLTDVLNHFSHRYPMLTPRVIKTLLIRMMDDNATVAQKYGATTTLAKMGNVIVKTVLLPQLSSLSPFLASAPIDPSSAMDIDEPVQSPGSVGSDRLLRVLAPAIANVFKFESNVKDEFQGKLGDRLEAEVAKHLMSQ
ncbi:hypothetical protein BC828DRAFT_390260 [Blastocladiella britannica]|nr:hypothetical protein BC828DRAFT_390260 [Blastocladiella britannica]